MDKKKNLKMNALSKLRRGSAALYKAGSRRRSKMGNRNTQGRLTHTKEVNATTLPRPVDKEESSPSPTSDIIPPPKLSLYERLDRKLFKADLGGKKYSDIIRTAHAVSVEVKRRGQPVDVIEPCSIVTEDDEPEKLPREMKRMMVLLEHLYKYFCAKASDKEIEQDLTACTFSFFDRYKAGEIEKRQFNLSRLFKELQTTFGEQENHLEVLLKVRSVLKFLHISVVIFSIEEMRDKLELGIDHLTKDVKNGWKIRLRLNPRYVEVCHLRRECVLKQQGEQNYWEIAYNVTLSFSPTMTKFTAVRLSLTDLMLSENMDEEKGKTLKEKFFNGKFIVC